jgi:hypothetical protein
MNTPKKPRPLSPIQRQAAEILANHHSISHTSTVLKLRKETLRRWKEREDFRAHMAKCSKELHERAMRQLPQMQDYLILALMNNLRNGNDNTALQLLKLLGPEKLFSLQGLPAPSNEFPVPSTLPAISALPA